MVASARGAARSDRAGAAQVRDDGEHDEEDDQRAADQGDPADVAPDVGVLLGGGDREGAARAASAGRRARGGVPVAGRRRASSAARSSARIWASSSAARASSCGVRRRRARRRDRRRTVSAVGGRSSFAGAAGAGRVGGCRGRVSPWWGGALVADGADVGGEDSTAAATGRRTGLPARLRPPPRRTHPSISASHRPNLGGIVVLLTVAVVVLAVAVVWLVSSVDAARGAAVRADAWRRGPEPRGGPRRPPREGPRGGPPARRRGGADRGPRGGPAQGVPAGRARPLQPVRGDGREPELRARAARRERRRLGPLEPPRPPGTRVYAKAIAGGRSEAALSEEEAAAIKQATA